MAKKKRKKKVYSEKNLTAKQSQYIDKLPHMEGGFAAYKKKTGKTSRRQYNNYRARKAGFKDYATWMKARKDIGKKVGVKIPKGKKKPKEDKTGGKAYKFNWTDENQAENERKLRELLESQGKDMGAQFVVYSNDYKTNANRLDDFSYASTYSFPIRGSKGWLNGKRIPEGMDISDFLREEFAIRPYAKSKKYGNGIKTLWVYIQPQKE